MTNPYLLPLAMLYVDGRREVDGVTRFQKLVFLAQEEAGLGDLFTFESHKYGPFSKELYKGLDELESKNLVRQEKVRTRSGNEKIVYTLTGRGQQVLKHYLNNDEEDVKPVFDAVQKIKQEHNDKPLERLLRYVYNKYPDYTGESEILSEDGEIDLDLAS